MRILIQNELQDKTPLSTRTPPPPPKHKMTPPSIRNNKNQIFKLMWVDPARVLGVNVSGCVMYVQCYVWTNNS